MAQKEIGLKLKITTDGTEKVISNLNDLETELGRLQNELKTADFGSARFKELSINIQTLKSRIEDVDKATEGIGVEKRLRAINDTANLLTGSFQFLSGVVGTLTQDEATLKEVQEAETRAMNVLNIALGVRAINEGILESKIFRRELAEKAAILTSKAYIASAKGISAALNFVGISAGVASTGVRVLTTALSALGLPLIIFGLTELYNLLTDVNEEAPKIKNATEAYDEFNKKIENTTSILDIYIERERILGSDRVANEKELAKIQDEIDKRLVKQRELWDDLLYAQQRSDVARQGGEKEKQKAADEEIKRIKEVQRQNDLAISKLENRRLTAEQNITKITKEEEAKRTRDAEDAAKKREARRLKEIQNRLEVQKKYLEGLKVLVEDELKVESQVLEKIKEVIQKQEELIKERNEFAKSESEKLGEEIDKLFFKIIPGKEERKLLEDTYLKLFDGVNAGVKSGLIDLKDYLDENGKITFDGLVKAFNDLQNKSSAAIGGIADPVLLEADKISKALTGEARIALLNYFNTIERFAKELSNPKNKDLVSNIVSVDKARVDESKDAILGFIDEAVKGLNDETLLAGELEQNLTKIVQNRLGLTKRVVKGTEEQKAEATAYNERIQILSDTLVQLAIREGKVVVESAKVGAELKNLKNQVDLNENELQKYTSGFIKDLLPATKLTETQIANFGETLKNAFGSSSEAFTGFIQNLINNTGGVRDKLLDIIDPQTFVKLIGEVSKSVANVSFSSVKEIQDLISLVQTLQTEFGDAIITGEVNGEKLGAGYSTFSALIDELNKKLKELQKNTTEVAKTWEETFSESKFKKIADGILQAFGDISSRLSNIISTQNSLILEQLQYQEELAIASVEAALGQSVEGDKRIAEEKEAIQKEFAKKKFEADKKARVQELQFTLANTLAQAAQAIVNALASIPAPFGAIYSGVIAGLTAAQVAVINDQIQFTQNKVFVGRRGGLIEGASHDEMSGGVPAMLEGGEFVVNKEAVKRYGDIIGSINNSTGGRPLTIDDSRLVQAIASQNTTKSPIKTYVLYNDIKDTNKLNNKIEQLSRL